MLVACGMAGGRPELAGRALVRAAIDPDGLRAAVADPAVGAQVVCVGTARGVTDGVATIGLEYEAHEPLAEEAIARLATDALGRFGLVACAVEHRLGRVGIGAAAVALATSAPHRAAASGCTRVAHPLASWGMRHDEASSPRPSPRGRGRSAAAHSLRHSPAGSA
ncbi:MAG: molybdenum cofactor biosynthesis protein MoaE [Planctomycetaceae bacterium]